MRSTPRPGSHAGRNVRPGDRARIRASSEVGGVYRGYAGLRSWHQDLMDRWEYIQLELERLVEVGSRHLHRARALGRESHRQRGRGLVSESLICIRSAAGKLDSNRHVPRPAAEALEAGGLRSSRCRRRTWRSWALYTAVQRRDIDAPSRWSTKTSSGICPGCRASPTWAKVVPRTRRHPRSSGATGLPPGRTIEFRTSCSGDHGDARHRRSGAAQL